MGGIYVKGLLPGGASEGKIAKGRMTSTISSQIESLFRIYSVSITISINLRGIWTSAAGSIYLWAGGAGTQMPSDILEGREPLQIFMKQCWTLPFI